MLLLSKLLLLVLLLHPSLSGPVLAWLVSSLPTFRRGRVVGGMEADPWASQSFSRRFSLSQQYVPVVPRPECSSLHPSHYLPATALSLGLREAFLEYRIQRRFSVLFTSAPSWFLSQGLQMWNSFYLFCPSFPWDSHRHQVETGTCLHSLFFLLVLILFLLLHFLSHFSLLLFLCCSSPQPKL